MPYATYLESTFLQVNAFWNSLHRIPPRCVFLCSITAKDGYDRAIAHTILVYLIRYPYRSCYHGRTLASSGGVGTNPTRWASCGSCCLAVDTRHLHNNMKKVNKIRNKKRTHILDTVHILFLCLCVAQYQMWWLGTPSLKCYHTDTDVISLAMVFPIIC